MIQRLLALALVGLGRGIAGAFLVSLAQFLAGALQVEVEQLALPALRHLLDLRLQNGDLLRATGRGRTRVQHERTERPDRG